MRRPAIALIALLSLGCLSGGSLPWLAERARAPSSVQTPAPSWFEDAHPIGGNAVQVFEKGSDFDGARIRLILDAKKSIYISTFGWDDDRWGMFFLNLLCQRAHNHNVDVRLMVDPIMGGSSKIVNYSDSLRSCGIRIIYVAPNGGWGPSNIIKGIHEKFMIVDGKSAIVGGSGFNNDYHDYSIDSTKWYDLNFKIDGPAACHFQNQFEDTWRRFSAIMSDYDDTEGGLVNGDYVHCHYPHIDNFDRWNQGPIGEGTCQRLGKTVSIDDYFFGLDEMQPCTGTPDMGNVRLVPSYSNPILRQGDPNLEKYIQAIRAVPDDGMIRLYSPYFVPSQELVNALLEARARDVEVKVLTNSLESMDTSGAVVMMSSYLTTRKLRAAGVEIYQWPKKSTMHRKGGVFGDQIAFFGSDNLDRRGQHEQSEDAIFTDDPKVVAQMTADLDRDFAASHLVSESFVRHEMDRFSDLVKAASALLKNHL